MPKIPFLKQFDQDYPADERRVAIFNKEDKYRLKGRIHDLRSNAIKYAKPIIRNFYNKLVRDALRIIKTAPEIYILANGVTIISGDDKAKLLVRKNKKILQNTFDLLHDKERLQKPLNHIEIQLLELVDVLTDRYIKACKIFKSSAINTEKVTLTQLEKLVSTKSTITFTMGNNTIYFNFSNAQYAEFKGAKFVTYQILPVESKEEIIAYWEEKIPKIQSQNFINLIKRLQGIDIGGFDKEVTLRPQDEIETVAPEIEIPPRPIDPEVRQNVEKVITKTLRKKRMKVNKQFIVNKEYMVGTKQNGQKVAVDWDGKTYDLEEFEEVVQKRSKIEKKLNNIHKIGVYLGTLDKVPDEKLRELVQVKKIEYDFLTDNKKLRGKLTRTYPTVVHKDRRLIVGGRFRGYYLDDMINRMGRQVAGSAYVLGDDGLPKPMEYKEGELTKFRVENEPYLTLLDNGSFRLILPSWAKEDSKALTELKKTYKTIKQINKTTFDITIDDFDMVNETLGGITMSESASEEITKMIAYRKKLNKIETEKLYGDITFDTVPGMNPDAGEFMEHQKKAIKITLEKDGNTVIGLTTGTGKSIVAIGILQKWLSDGTLTKDGKNGKALFVVPAALRGNFPSEMKKFCKNVKELFEHIDIVSYDEFRKNAEQYKEYGAIFFDEAQHVRKASSKVGRAALKLDHPRKIPLTASTIEKSPQDLFNLVSITRNLYSDPDTYRKMLRKFIVTFCETVGGKVIGLKDDPVIKKKFRAWVKENTVYVDKEEVAEAPLPNITPPDGQTESITMTRGVSRKYNELSEPIRDTLKRMVEKYKDGTLKTTEINQELSRALGQIQILKNFLNNPDDYLNVPNPKINILQERISEAFQKNDFSKAMIWTDSPGLAEKAAVAVSNEIPFKKHVLALATEIRVYRNGKVIEKYRNNSKLQDTDGETVPKKDWQIFLLGRYNNDPEVGAFCLTKAYTTGYNLQSANTIIHLDRDSWNNENMKQRNARAWRTGQENPVSVSILDLVNNDGTSLDVIQKYSMEIERSLFDNLIKASKDAKIETKFSVTDIEGLIKNKEALQYLLNPKIELSKDIKNVKG